MTTDLTSQDYIHFLEDLKSRVSTSRYRAVLSVNSEMIMLYHYIGTEIIRRQEKHGWGAKVIGQLSVDLRSSFPGMKGFSVTSLNYMKAFAIIVPDNQIFPQLVGKLPWGHIRCLIDAFQDKEMLFWYGNQAIENGWSLQG